LTDTSALTEVLKRLNHKRYRYYLDPLSREHIDITNKIDEVIALIINIHKADLEEMTK